MDASRRTSDARVRRTKDGMMAPKQMDADAMDEGNVALSEEIIEEQVEVLAAMGIRVTGIDVNDDGSVTILWEREDGD